MYFISSAFADCQGNNLNFKTLMDHMANTFDRTIL